MTNPITPLTPEQTAALEARVKKEGYLRRLPVAVDIFVDEVAGGPMDMTISSRWANAAKAGKWWGILGSRFLNIFQNNHGAKAVAGDLERAQNLQKIEDNSGIVPKG